MAVQVTGTASSDSRNYGTSKTVNTLNNFQQGDRRKVGITEESIDLTAIGSSTGLTPLVVVVHNLDSVNIVRVGWATGVYFADLPPLSSQPCYVPAGTSQMFLVALVAPCDVEWHEWAD